jgi:dihydrofolate synthase / folylpolyglutamate synthase
MPLASGDPLDYLFGLEQFGIKFGLDNITALVEALGRPDRAFRSVHVAGTNAKGSVTAMVDHGLRAAGHRTGRYTSPHLVDLSERFVINGTPVAPEPLRAAIARAREAAASLQAIGTLAGPPTFFEVTTAVAFELFRRERVDIAVCEVGLGGRLDATNVLTPAVSAITSIAFDHQQYLGTTLAAIAFEKAGIIKPGVPVVVGEITGSPAEVIARVAAERGAPLVWAHQGVRVGDVQAEQDGTRFRLSTAAHDYGPLWLSLAGYHQVGNAVLAVRILEVLNDLGTAVPPAAVALGLAAVQWPGRLERIVRPGGRELLLDAAHNPAGAATLASYLVATGEKRPLVFAAMRDKDVAGILNALAPAVSAIVVTRSSNRRSAEPADLARILGTSAPDLPVVVRATPASALEIAWEMSPRIVVAGSIFLLGDVIKELGRS